MSRIEDFGSTTNVAVTVLVDNRADMIPRSTDTVIRYTKKPLLAEHGFAALIDLRDAGVRILWDAGATSTALMGNMQTMEIDPTQIDAIALSHGHFDHTGAVPEALRAIGRPTPLIAHPTVFREHWAIDREGQAHGPIHPAPASEWEAAGAEIVLSTGPYRLGPGCWTTGYVPRKTFEQAGVPKGRYTKEGGEMIPDHVDDDQAIAIHVAGKGLVVVAGCAHAGILNTIYAAQEISGVDRVWAAMGGFHLGRTPEEEMQRTIDGVAALEPKLIVPEHCTGFEAIRRFAEQMPEAFSLGLVGTTYLF
ncbi:MAG: MBL fold metallo-hydrolase [Anaerolineae bacterium]|nr:MBL fold metallo-hydrolase [Anaerolineae bacterium]